VLLLRAAFAGAWAGGGYQASALLGAPTAFHLRADNRILCGRSARGRKADAERLLFD
jgi:hypothetical protein